MPKLNLEFDLDGILIDYHSVLEWHLANNYDTKMISTGKFHFGTDPEMSVVELEDAIYSAMDFTGKIKPHPGAHEVLKELYRITGEPIKIITARPKNKVVQTVASIDRVLGDIPYLFAMVDSGMDKPKYVRSKCFIDDRRRTAIDMASRGYTVFMPEREYNLPIDPGEHYAVWENGKVRHSGRWGRNDGHIFVIKDIESLLDPVNLQMIIS